MRTVLALLASLTATLLLVELGAIALVRGGTVSAPRPHHGETGFWWHHHPEFGAWHHPDTEGDHNGPCYKARYEINAVGARDVDRPERAPGRRVVVLATGDPLWFSVGARIGRAIDPAEITYHPQVSAFQLASARMGWSVADVETLTVQ